MQATSLAQAEPTRDPEVELTKVLKDLLKPVKVKKVVVTKSDKYTVRGIVLMVCPLEKRESDRDFEIGLDGDATDRVQYVVVDGRRLFPKRGHAGGSKRGGDEGRCRAPLASGVHLVAGTNRLGIRIEGQAAQREWLRAD